MRLAVVSDIHSNIEALTKALEVIDTLGVEEIICLGDVVGYGANPNECLEAVRRRCRTILLGNHDLAAVDVSAAEYFTHHARLAAHWTNRALSSENKSFLRQLPYTSAKPDMFFVHASPNEPEEWHYIISIFDAFEAFKAFEQKVCFVGHSHVPAVFSSGGRVVSVTRDDRFLVNVGSIGQPRDGNPQLSFGVFETETWTYENIREDYDVEQASMKIIEAGLPRPLADRLLVGA